MLVVSAKLKDTILPWPKTLFQFVENPNELLGNPIQNIGRAVIIIKAHYPGQPRNSFMPSSYRHIPRSTATIERLDLNRS